MKKIIISLLLSSVFLSLCVWSYLWLTDGFSLNNISIDSPISVHAISSEINEILNQPYTYLGKGAQVYAFESRDGKYVLKLVKQKHHKLTRCEDWVLRLPALEGYRQKKIQKRHAKHEAFIASARLAYEKLKEETGLIYLHLERTQREHHCISIRDKLGICRPIDLDKTEFILQKKAQNWTSRIASLMKNHDIQNAREALAQIAHLLFNASQKGIFDNDSRSLHNIGFLDKAAIFIDTGELYEATGCYNSDQIENRLTSYLKPLNDWLAKNYPALKIDAKNSQVTPP